MLNSPPSQSAYLFVSDLDCHNCHSSSETSTRHMTLLWLTRAESVGCLIQRPPFQLFKALRHQKDKAQLHIPIDPLPPILSSCSDSNSILYDCVPLLVQEGQPCCNEKLLLMFDRWRKLLKGFFDSKKKVFDISKVPDIYDSAKYDAIHNSELGLNVESLYLVSLPPSLSLSACMRQIGTSAHAWYQHSCNTHALYVPCSALQIFSRAQSRLCNDSRRPPFEADLRVDVTTDGPFPSSAIAVKIHSGLRYAVDRCHV